MYFVDLRISTNVITAADDGAISATASLWPASIPDHSVPDLRRRKPRSLSTSVTRTCAKRLRIPALSSSISMSALTPSSSTRSRLTNTKSWKPSAALTALPSSTRLNQHRLPPPPQRKQATGVTYDASSHETITISTSTTPQLKCHLPNSTRPAVKASSRP